MAPAKLQASYAFSLFLLLHRYNYILFKKFALVDALVLSHSFYVLYGIIIARVNVFSRSSPLSKSTTTTLFFFFYYSRSRALMKRLLDPEKKKQKTKNKNALAPLCVQFSNVAELSRCRA